MLSHSLSLSLCLASFLPCFLSLQVLSFYVGTGHTPPFCVWKSFQISCSLLGSFGIWGGVSGFCFWITQSRPFLGDF